MEPFHRGQRRSFRAPGRDGGRPQRGQSEPITRPGHWRRRPLDCGLPSAGFCADEQGASRVLNSCPRRGDAAAGLGALGRCVAPCRWRGQDAGGARPPPWFVHAMSWCGEQHATCRSGEAGRRLSSRHAAPERGRAREAAAIGTWCLAPRAPSSCRACLLANFRRRLGRASRSGVAGAAGTTRCCGHWPLLLARRFTARTTGASTQQRSPRRCSGRGVATGFGRPMHASVSSLAQIASCMQASEC